jgi:hypothetical protein
MNSSILCATWKMLVRFCDSVGFNRLKIRSSVSELILLAIGSALTILVASKMVWWFIMIIGVQEAVS